MAETKTKVSKTTKSIKTTTKPATKKTTVKKADTKKKTEKTALSAGAKKVYDVFVGHEHFFELFCEGYLHRHRDKYGNPEINPKKTRDGGWDIRCFKEDDYETTIYYISCKNMEKIGPDPIRLIKGETPSNSDDSDTLYVPMIMTSGILTDDAKKTAKSLGVKVIDGNMLATEKRIG